jgi:predicted RNA-binding Zn ribbon-like protein
MGDIAVEWLCIDFLNSDWRDWRGSGRRENRLDKPDWMEQFFQQWDLHAPFPADEPHKLALLELRERMRSMVESIASGGSLATEDLSELNRVLALAPSHTRVIPAEEGYCLEQVSLVEGWDQVMARIAGSFADLLAHQDVRRIKICDNDDCKWVYFDESKNRVRRWCNDKMCGNLMKVRRFRERQKNKG